jgi:recombination associated protein RdgC
MIKNLILYRFNGAVYADELARELVKFPFTPCGPTQQRSVGWVPPRGEEHGLIAEVVDGQIILKASLEQRMVPASVVARRVDEISAQIEKTTGRKPGKKQKKDLKEQALLELLPAAFTKQSSTTVWIDPEAKTLVIGSGSQGRADEIVTMLVKAADGLAVSLIQTETSPQVAMAHWLASGEPPHSFTVDHECELKSTDELKSTVRYNRHTLDTDEVKQHITSGKVPTRLALTWRDRLCFTLTQGGQLKKIDLLDVVFEGTEKAPNRNDAFEADVTIFTGEMRQLIPDLIEALGGDVVISAEQPLTPDAATSEAEEGAPAWA